MASTAAQLGQIFMGAGMSRAGAAGVIGNLMQESSLNAGAPGGGLAQWTGPRLGALQNFARSQGSTPDDPVVQAHFLVNEMKTQYGGLFRELQTSTDPRAAALAVSQQYERPGMPMNQNRMTYAAQAFGQLGPSPSMAAIAGRMANRQPGGAGGFNVTSIAPTTTTNTDQAIEDAMLQEASSPVDTSGKVSVKNPLSDALSLINTGAYTTSTPAQTQITAAARAGAVGQQSITAAAVNAAGSAGAGADAQKLLGMLHQVIGGSYNQGNHADIGETAQQVRAQGTDCSGLISWLMGPRGLGIWQTSLATPSIASAPGMQSGRGSVVTVWNNKQPGNSGHVFIQIGNQFFASEGGTGIRQISTAEAEAYIAHGSDGGIYQPLHPKGL